MNLEQLWMKSYYINSINGNGGRKRNQAPAGAARYAVKFCEFSGAMG